MLFPVDGKKSCPEIYLAIAKIYNCLALLPLKGGRVLQTHLKTLRGE